MKSLLVLFLLLRCLAVSSPASYETKLQLLLDTLTEYVDERSLTEDNEDHEDAGVSKDMIDEFRENFINDGKLRLAQNSCTKHGPMETCRNQFSEMSNIHHVFNHVIEPEGSPVTDQKMSGRCWIFACLNVMRIPIIKQFNLTCFELSESYLFYWDKIERANYMLHMLVEINRKGTPPSSRLMKHLLSDPSSDGGEWNYLVNLINKYGVMPKENFPETGNSMTSIQMNEILNSYIRKCNQQIQEMFVNGSEPSEEHLSSQLKTMMSEIYKIVNLCLGTPSNEFIWEYYDKHNEYHRMGPISPLQFYKQHVKTHFDVNNKVELINDPRKDSPYRRLYTTKYLNNMFGGVSQKHINLPMEVLKAAAAKSIMDNEAVWFGCDVMKFSSWGKLGMQDLDLYDYENVFGFMPSLDLTKAQRLLQFESSPTHAMALTGLQTTQEGNITKWRVQNSWSREGGDQGYFVMTDHWFTEFGFEVVVDKKYIPDDILEILEEEPIILPAWDPINAMKC